MPTLDELDVLCTYLDDQEMYHPYHPPLGNKVKHRALRPSPVIWIVKDGKPVDFRGDKDEMAK